MLRKYDASSITIFSQIEGVRSHPGMYLGDVDANGTLQCFREILQNATDEVTECGGGNIIIRINGSNILVADEGRGFPIDIHPKTKRPAIESVLTRLHAGGKSGDKTAYGNRTVGVHGVGASVVNALSKRMTVWTYRNNNWWRIDFAKGIVTKALHKARPPTALRCGSVVEYELDDSILKSPLVLANARQLCNLARHFSPVDINYEDEEKRAILKRRNPIDLLNTIIKHQDVEEYIPPITINHNGVRLVCCWVNASDTNIQGYVSGAPVGNGTHIKGLEEAITEAIRAASPREAKGCDNVLIGLRAVLDVTVDQPSFSGQAKHTLKTPSARKQVIEAVSDSLTKILRKQKIAVKLMLENATRISRIDAQHADMKQMAKAASGPRGKLSFPKGFLAALSYPPDRRELFLVEGDSAGTSMKAAKMPWQEVLKLRGKMANVINKTGAVNNSEVVGNILRVIGYDPRNPDKPSRVGKVIILTDADDDGHHIAVLLLTVFQQVMPSLLTNGKIYMVETPLFEATTSKGEVVAGDSLSDMEKLYGKLSKVNRMKGLAGCKASMLRRFAADPDTRNLVRIAAPNRQEVSGLLALMGSDSSARKKLLHSERGTNERAELKRSPRSTGSNERGREKTHRRNT